MKNRWLTMGVLAGVLFAINVAARLVIRLGFDNDSEWSDRVSLGMFALIGVVLAVRAFLVGKREPVAQWGPDMAASVLVAMALTIFIGPFINGSEPFANGAGQFFSQIWLYGGFALGGALVGFLILTAFGLDHRSQSLKHYAETSQAKPRKVVRR